MARKKKLQYELEIGSLKKVLRQSLLGVDNLKERVTSLENVLISAGILIEVFEPKQPEPAKFDHKVLEAESYYDPYSGQYNFTGHTKVKKYAVAKPVKKGTKRASK